MPLTAISEASVLEGLGDTILSQSGDPVWDEHQARANVAACAHELMRLAKTLEAQGLGLQWRGVSRDTCERELRTIEEDLAYCSLALQGALGMRT